eukprot:jgi/Mesvir1/11463/Mv04609-RA.1
MAAISHRTPVAIACGQGAKSTSKASPKSLRQGEDLSRVASYVGSVVDKQEQQIAQQEAARAEEKQHHTTVIDNMESEAGQLRSRISAMRAKLMESLPAPSEQAIAAAALWPVASQGGHLAVFGGQAGAMAQTDAAVTVAASAETRDARGPAVAAASSYTTPTAAPISTSSSSVVASSVASPAKEISVSQQLAASQASVESAIALYDTVRSLEVPLVPRLDVPDSILVAQKAEVADLAAKFIKKFAK